MEKYKACLHSPIGWLEITGSEKGIASIYFHDEKTNEMNPAIVPPVLKPCIDQLKEFFAGSRKEFQLQLDPEGTEFQLKVWSELIHIPFGTTFSYIQLAKVINNEKAVRAVGSANGQNKIAIVIPCHRVIGANATLTGYSGGLERKRWLLEHEQNHSENRPLNLFTTA